MEDNLEEEVPQLLAERPPGAALPDPVHLVEHLVGLLDEVGTEGPDVLRAVPGAAALGTQGAHDLLQPLHGLSRASHVLLDPAPGNDPTCWVRAALAYHGLTRLNEMASPRAAAALLATLVVLASTGAAAQIEPPRPVEELAPDGPAQRPSRTRREPPPPAPEPEQEVPGAEAQEPAHPPPPPPPVRRSTRNRQPAPAPEAPTAPSAPPGRDRTPPPPLLVPTEGDDALLQAFGAWKEAERTRDPKASRSARERLVELRDSLAIANLESVSLALLRGARVRAAGKDGAGAVELAQSAVTLSPDVAKAHWGLFRAHLGNDPFDLRRLWADARNAGRAALADPRWSRGLLGDLGATVLVAWLATTLAALLVLFLRTVPSLVHDVHHAFPKGVARWQAGALLILVLMLPWVFRLGLLFPSLVLFAAVTLYVEAKERWLLAVLLAGACLVAPLAGALVQATTFAGTPAEDVLQLERGGLEAAPAAAHVQARLDAGPGDLPRGVCPGALGAPARQAGAGARPRGEGARPPGR